jgi:hypothetical protein
VAAATRSPVIGRLRGRQIVAFHLVDEVGVEVVAGIVIGIGGADGRDLVGRLSAEGGVDGVFVGAHAVHRLEELRRGLRHRRRIGRTAGRRRGWGARLRLPPFFIAAARR